MSTTPSNDLNDVIVSAVNARVETAVLEALSGDEFFGRMVAATLAQKIEVPDGGYSRRKTTFLAHTLETVIQQAVQDATKRLVTEEAAAIEEAVRKELRRSSGDLAKQLVGSMSDAAEKVYGIKVELQYPGRGY
jgi:hypothetical protein